MIEMRMIEMFHDRDEDDRDEDDRDVDDDKLCYIINHSGLMISFITHAVIDDRMDHYVNYST